MITKLSISFGAYTDANLQTLSESILQSMTNNPNFPNPTPTIADFSNAVAKYNDAIDTG